MNVNLLCPQHKSQIISACVDLECQVFPFMCKECEQSTIAQHTKHHQCLKPYQQYVTLLSKQVEENLHDINKLSELFLKETQTIQYLLNQDQHLKNVEGCIRSSKELIESDINHAIETITYRFQLYKNELVNQLDQYYKVYRNNFFAFKELVEPIHFLVSKCRYYGNENNLKLKLHTKPDLGIQLKESIKQIQIVKKPEVLKSLFDTLNSQQLFQYNNENFDKLMQDINNMITDYYTKSAKIPVLTNIEIPQYAPPKQLEISEKLTNIDKISVIDDIKTNISEVKNQIQPQTLPIINISIVDSRIIDDPMPYKTNQKFKIKKRLTLEFMVSSLSFVSNTLVALGLNDGTLKLLDLTTSKVSFYPNTYIQHTRPVCQLIQLKQNKGTRLASLSDENYCIIWTLGENCVPYPERKLIGFKSKLNRVMDIADCSHILCQSDTNLYIVNFLDNRISYTFDFKHQLIEFLYVSKYEKFATISQGNMVSIYSLKMNSTLQGAMLLVNCELEQPVRIKEITNITCCIATDIQGEIVICYGCADGSVKIFNVLKNILLGEFQLFDNKIKEMIIIKQGQLLILAIFADNSKNIKAILIQDNKLTTLEKYGELLDTLATQGKNAIQAFIRNRSAVLLLSSSQRDIGLYELC